MCSASNAARTILSVARPDTPVSLAEVLRKMASGTGGSLGQVVADFASLAAGPGRMELDGFIAMRLFDRAFHADVDRKAFAGLHTSRRIWTRANYDAEHYALADNKLACNALLSAYGLTAVPTLALYSEHLGWPAPNLLRGAAALSGFLSQPAHYPLFGKPLDGLQSLGCISLDHYEPAVDGGEGHVVTVVGERFPLDRLVAEIRTSYPQGYLFQRRVVPHAAVRRLCGERLSTVRMLTTLIDGEPRLWRACWKIPAGANAADNFWRPGNLLARIDPATGMVGRALRGRGVTLETVTHHPDSGMPITGTGVPNWSAVTALALEGARLMSAFGLVGWDIAPTDEGATIVEMNYSPDLLLPQLADGTGVLDPPFRAFLATRRREQAVARRQTKRKGAQPMFAGYRFGPDFT